MRPEEYEVFWKPDLREISPVRVNPVLLHPAEQRVALNGTWKFRLDPGEEGLKQKWYCKPWILRDKIRVPGCWQGQGFGHDGLDEIRDFRIEARVFRATYKGTGWYAKTFTVPPEWKNKHVRINFGGVHPSADIFVNGEHVGSHSGPFVPFAFDITEFVNWHRRNTLVVRVHELNRWMGFTYNWMGSWSGLYRSVELTAVGHVWFESLWLRPDREKSSVHLAVRTGGAQGYHARLAVSVSGVSKPDAPVCGQWDIESQQTAEFHLPVTRPLPWSPDAPNLYRLDATLMAEGQPLDALRERFGFMTLSAKGKHILINDEPYYIRGTGDFMVNPETGSPDTDRGRWRRKLAVLRQYGYNQVRCQSYAPPPEYYDAADEAGLLVQAEMGMLGAWSGHSPWHVYPWPPPTPRWREAIMWQWERTVMRDVNHPSAAMYCMGNELGNKTLYPRIAWQCYHRTKAIKPDCFVIYTDGGFRKDLPADFVNAEAEADKDTNLPVIQHEYRWWSAYPDISAKEKFTGAIRPYHIEIAAQAARKHGLERLLPTMARTSQQLQYVESRAKMEICRRDNPALAGISHFNAMDIFISPLGIIDEFYEKKLISAQTWQKTNGDTVVMMSLDFDGRVLEEGRYLQCRFSVSDFSHPPFRNPVIEWTLAAAAKILAKGMTRFKHEPFKTVPAGRIAIKMPRVGQPVKLTLRAVLRDGKRSVDNEWPFWLFPRNIKPPATAAVYGKPVFTWLKTLRNIPLWTPQHIKKQAPAVVLAETFDKELLDYIRRGGRVVLAAGEGLVRPLTKKAFGSGGYFFLPPANYPPLEEGQSGSIVTSHRMLGTMPHEGFADLQFYRLIRNAPPVDLEPLGLGRARPVVRAVCKYFIAAPLAYLTEFALGKGGIIICALELDQQFPEARYLLGSILRYAVSSVFRPKDRLTEDAVRNMLKAMDFA